MVKSAKAYHGGRRRGPNPGPRTKPAPLWRRTTCIHAHQNSGVGRKPLTAADPLPRRRRRKAVSQLGLMNSFVVRIQRRFPVYTFVFPTIIFRLPFSHPRSPTFVQQRQILHVGRVFYNLIDLKTVEEANLINLMHSVRSLLSTLTSFVSKVKGIEEALKRLPVLELTVFVRRCGPCLGLPASCALVATHSPRTHSSLAKLLTQETSIRIILLMVMSTVTNETSFFDFGDYSKLHLMEQLFLNPVNNDLRY